MEMKKETRFSYSEYPNTDELPYDLKLIAHKAQEALKTSYSPYSHFAVGAAIMLKNGEIIQGSNQENGAYPSGLCAERVALFYAGSAFPKVPVKAIAVAASYKGKPTDMPVSPCGGCRQVMLETRNIGKEPLVIVMVGKKKVIVVEDVIFLLPFTFSNINDAIKD